MLKNEFDRINNSESSNIISKVIKEIYYLLTNKEYSIENEYYKSIIVAYLNKLLIKIDTTKNIESLSDLFIINRQIRTLNILNEIKELALLFKKC